jgi:hypothetical protein
MLMNDEQRYYAERDMASTMNSEQIKNDILRNLAISDGFGDFESAEEKKASLELDEILYGTVADNKTAMKIEEAASTWYCEGRISGFKAGFQMATKLFVAGMG